LTAIDGSIWLAGRNAKVFRIDYSDQQYTTYQNLHFQCESPLGTCWYLEKTGAVIKHEVERNLWMKYSVEDGLLDAPVVLTTAGNGSIWAAGSHQGQAAVAYHDGQQWHLHRFPELGFGISAYSAFESTSGDMLFGSASQKIWDPNCEGGLIRFFLTDQTYTYGHQKNPLVPFRIVGIAQTNEGLWFGGAKLARFDGYRTHDIENPVSLFTGWIDHIIHTNSGELWVAKGGDGIFRYDGQSWTQYTMQHGLASNMVTYTLAHRDGTVWAATDAGISCFDGHQWQTLATPASFRMERESGSLRVSADGDVWINRATREWYFRAMDPNLVDVTADHPFLTTRYRPDKAPPDTEIDLITERIQSASPIHISWTGRDTWSVTPKDRLLYAYRMDQGPWSPFTTDTTQTWYNLPAGSHTIEVRARDRDRNIDPTPAKATFTVLLPTWRQPWFLLLIASLLLAITVLVVRLIKAHEIHVTQQIRFEKEKALQQLQFEKEKALQELAIDESRLAFFTNISHELRTPLTLIAGPVETLLGKLKDIDLKEQAQLIKRNADRLLQLVNQLLDIRKLQAGKLQLRLTENDLIGFMCGIMASMESAAQQKQLTLTFETAVTQLPTAFDLDKLEKVLVNLISNAIKFTDKGGGITVVIRPGDRQFEISVEDNGIGIPKDQLDRVFERFHRVDKDGATPGSGIGLALARELVQLHGGDLRVESPINPQDDTRPGTRFTVTIPQDKAKTIDIKEDPPKQEVIDQEADTPPTVLIVEDNEDMRHYVGSILKQEYQLIEAANGQQGLRLAHQNIPDLIISDIMMPEMDGIELCRLLKNDEDTSHIPIILLTAKGSEAAHVEGLKTGADDYIVKPFSQAVLQARLANLLESRRRSQEHFQKEPSMSLPQITSNPVDEKFLRRAVKTVEANMADYDYAMESFSSHMHMSRSTLYRKIKAVTGQSPSVFIRTIRLKHAAELLKTGQYNVSEVAYQVGFMEMTYFGRCFKKQFQCTPSEYISQNQAQNG